MVNKLETGRFSLEKPLWVTRTGVTPNMEKEPLCHPEWAPAMHGRSLCLVRLG